MFMKEQWKEELHIELCKFWEEHSDGAGSLQPFIWSDFEKQAQVFISTQFEKLINEMFADMPTAGESGEIIYLDVNEGQGFKQQLRDKWLK